MNLQPQPGPQMQFMTTPADIAIFGGAAGGGKSYALLLEPLRYHGCGQYNAVIFRRNATQVTNPGGLWTESMKMYPYVRGTPRHAKLEWTFPSGALVKFAHLEHEDDKFSWQGAQLVLVGFDELTHFSESQFWFMLSRARSTSGVKSYIRATCNPDPDSFVHGLVSWWIDEDTGLPIRERSGRLRYFVRRDNNIVWGNSADEVVALVPGTERSDVMSLTFIVATVYDNEALLCCNPKYLANLKALPLVERERYLKGNWKIRATAGKVFRREWIEIVDAIPAGGQAVRYWDRAASRAERKSGDPDYTAGVRLRYVDGVFYWEDVRYFRRTPHEVRRLIRNTASADGTGLPIGLEQDPGQAGVAEVDYLIRELAGYNVRAFPVRADKVSRAKPASAQAEAGNLKMLRASWNTFALDQLENFPEGAHDDIVDATSGAMLMLTSSPPPRLRFF